MSADIDWCLVSIFLAAGQIYSGYVLAIILAFFLLTE